MSTPREDFLNAVKAVLDGMTGTRVVLGDVFTYPNVPRIELLYAPPALQNYRPYLALVEMEGSQATITDHAGGVDDDFRFDVFGQMGQVKGSVLSARTWSGRLRDDARRTLETAARYPGPLFARVTGIGCAWLTIGVESGGFDDHEADFSLPCTARLNYTLAIT